MNTYKPAEAYILQSGKKIGESLEQLMFKDYEWIVFMKNLLNEKNPKTKNRMHRHIEWILEQGENRQPMIQCPQCNQKTVVYFSYLGSERFGYSMSAAYTCCDNKECIEQLSAQGIEKMPTFLPITFSSITNFRQKGDQHRVADILKACFLLPKRLTKEVLFDFFNK